MRRLRLIDSPSDILWRRNPLTGRRYKRCVFLDTPKDPCVFSASETVHVTYNGVVGITPVGILEVCHWHAGQLKWVAGEDQIRRLPIPK
jgi:hypothetical protein